ncbi:GntR family transcriptional regulator [Oscillospiraceae bacterium HV4-5-C5C]|nr:GntR family transcriptional regulator [Oscillospiraceae bacterium HV4-5-C5C]
MYQLIARQLTQELNEGRYQPGMQLPSEQDICQQFSVSRITARHALDQLESQGLIKKVKGKGSLVCGRPSAGAAAAQALSRPAAGLKVTGRGEKLIGVIVPDYNEYFGLETVHAIEEACQKQGYFCVIQRSHGSMSAEEAAISRLKDLEVAGFIIMPVNGEYYNPRLIHLFLDHFPVVIIDRQIRGFAAPYIGTDNVTATKELMNYLFSLGHRKIALVAPPTAHTSSLEERQQAYQDAFWEQQLMTRPSWFFTEMCSPLPNLSFQDYVKSDMSHLKDFLLQQPEITAIFASEHLVAQLVLQAAAELGLRVPQELSVAFFDAPDVLARSGNYTYIRQDEQAIGSEAVRQLMLCINREPPQAQSPVTLIPGQLIIGRSTAAPRQAPLPAPAWQV